MISIPRLKKKGSGKKAMLLPTTFNVAIPTSVSDSELALRAARARLRHRARRKSRPQSSNASPPRWSEQLIAALPVLSVPRGR
jgi:hypothetical protein